MSLFPCTLRFGGDMAENPKPDAPQLNLDAQDLSFADLRGLDLSFKDFSCKRLCGAKLQQTQLYETTFRSADLSRAEFCDRAGTTERIAASQAKGLLPASLAGANLQGTLLPKEIADFPQLHNVEEASKNGATTLLAMLVACLFCLLTATTFSDTALITNSGLTGAIPGVGLTLPVQPFLYVAPFLLLIFQLYFILNLQRYEELIADFPSVFPDGLSLHSKIYPWLFSSLASISRNQRFGSRPALSLLEAALAIILTYFMVPACIWIIWFRALGGHALSAYSTVLALGASVIVSFIHFAVGRVTLRNGRGKSPRTQSLFPWWLWVAAGLAVILFAVGVGITIEARRGGVLPPPSYSLLGETPVKLSFRQRLLMSVGYFQSADVGGQDVSKKPASWTGRESVGEPELKSVIGPDLTYENLRYLRAYKSFLVNSRLNDADLTGAVLAWSDLRGSDLAGSKLMKVDFNGSKVSSAANPTRLAYANLEGADFSYATLSHANLSHSILTGTKFFKADLYRRA
jgi:uncharacterized protein YjbI with pentapeptide repeats